MSAVIFILAFAIWYYLYISYFKNKEVEENEKRRISHENSGLLNYEDYHTKFQSSIFKNFLQSITDRANNNHHSLVEERPDPFVFRAFEDRFQALSDVTDAIRSAGLKQCRVILGIDFTASNEWQGRKTHSGRSLHHLSNTRSTVQNPYQHVISVLQRTLGEFMQNPMNNIHIENPTVHSLRSRKVKQRQHIYAYGFGDSVTQDKTVFPIHPDDLPCSSFDEVTKYYKQIVPTVVLGGPTSYAPIIEKAIEIVTESEKLYHVLIIIADGQFVNPEPSAKAIVEASNCPLSIIVIGVGDGPWDILRKFDDWLPQRKFDNFQFVEYHKLLKNSNPKYSAETTFALHTLMEIPDQYKIVKELGLLEEPIPTQSLPSLKQ